VLRSQVQLDGGVAEECRLSFTDEHRKYEEVAFIDQPGAESGERSSATRDLSTR
jgi:hypothetical protein